VFVSATPPAPGSPLRAGWLPIGAEPFFLVLRLWGPGSLAQAGAYSPPPLYAFQGPLPADQSAEDAGSLDNIMQLQDGLLG
jgi:hypothetical protein